MLWRRAAVKPLPPAPAFPPRWHDHPHASAWTFAMGHFTRLADCPAPWPAVPDADGLALALYKATREFRDDWVHALLLLGADPHRELERLERTHRTAMHALLALPSQNVVDTYREHGALTWSRSVRDQTGQDYAAFAQEQAYGPRGSLGFQLARSIGAQWAQEDAEQLAHTVASALTDTMTQGPGPLPRSKPRL